MQQGYSRIPNEPPREDLISIIREKGEPQKCAQTLGLFDTYFTMLLEQGTAAVLAAYKTEDFGLAHYFVNKQYCNLFLVLDDSNLKLKQIRETLSLEAKADMCKILLELCAREVNSARPVTTKLAECVFEKKWTLSLKDAVVLNAIGIFNSSNLLKVSSLIRETCQSKPAQCGH